ncbi:uncharacterized protein sip2 isoform X2 [Epargyreus clarus]|uniref:uncharacterized protein sip2 isoform X2 n=1 Tax=Epargyreus clarus TaxID=520877 RepID=UPI003C2DC6AB
MVTTFYLHFHILLVLWSRVRPRRWLKNTLFANDFKIIETNSEPNMQYQRDSDEVVGDELKSTSDPVFNRPVVKRQVACDSPDFKSEDSFLEMEKAVTECMSPSKSKINLDNTLDVVDFILNHGSPHVKDKKPNISNEIKECVNAIKYLSCDIKGPEDEILSRSASFDGEQNGRLQKEEKTPTVSIQQPKTLVKDEPGLKQNPTRSKNIKLESGSFMNTPISNKKLATNIFKTPKIPLSIKKETPLKRTPSRTKGYDHIASPIATYIKNSPQVPLVKDVHPKKPLPSTSIPKLMKHVPESKISNKENVVLPPLAYRSAKKTTVINVNKEKLPQSQWVQKFTSSLRKPVVLKHNHREIARKPLVSQQEDSFADLTLHQAEVSVCTQKTAFHKPS